MSKLTGYLQKFKPVAADWFSNHTDEVRKNLEFCQEFFRREKLQRAEWHDIQGLGCLFAFSALALAGRKALGRANHETQHYRNSFMYLAHGPGEKAERIRNVLANTKYKLWGFSEAAISEIAAYLWPTEFVRIPGQGGHDSGIIPVSIPK